MIEKKSDKYNIEEKAVKVIYDGKQYNIRIPTEFAESMGINHNKHKFLFKLLLPLSIKKEPRLEGELINDEKKKSRRD